MALMVNSDCQFDSWLKNKLIELNTDDEVFSPYIKGILDSEECKEEKKEGLEGILSGIVEEESQTIQKLCEEILQEWDLYLVRELAKQNGNNTQINVDQKLVELMEKTKIKSTNPINPVVTPINSEQKKLKEAILAQYADVSSGEETDEESGTKNSNVEAVMKADKEKRDREKEDSQKKKEKDKEDRAKQKSKDEDRKEKEKKRTQKGEKRR